MRIFAIDPHCWYCGLALQPDDATLDHLVPRAAGGGTYGHNVRLACQLCNQAKGTALLSEIACAVPRGAGVVRIQAVS